VVEAEHHYIRALGLLGELPENVERDRRELELQLAVGPALIAFKGWAAPEVERAYTRAQELCDRLGDSPELFPALFGMWAMYLVRGELRGAYDLAEQLLRRAQRLSDRTLLLLAEFTLGTTSYWMGECLPAREHYEMAISIYDPERHRALAFRYLGVDPGVNCLLHAAWNLWFLGYPDQALKRSNEALVLAQRLSHPYSLAWAELFVLILRQYRGEARAVQENADGVIALCAEHGLTDFLAWASTLRGWAMAEQGRREEGVAQIKEGLVALRATRTELVRPYLLCLLAEACGETGRLDDARSALTEALAAADELENRTYEAEVIGSKASCC
jgi:predicted ATPase